MALDPMSRSSLLILGCLKEYAKPGVDYFSI